MPLVHGSGWYYCIKIPKITHVERTWRSVTYLTCSLYLHTWSMAPDHLVSGKISYLNILWSLTVVIIAVNMIVWLWNLASTSAILPPRRLSNARAIGFLGSLYNHISWLIFSARIPCDLVNRDPGMRNCNFLRSQHFIKFPYYHSLRGGDLCRKQWVQVVNLKKKMLKWLKQKYS